MAGQRESGSPTVVCLEPDSSIFSRKSFDSILDSSPRPESSDASQKDYDDSAQDDNLIRQQGRASSSELMDDPLVDFDMFLNQQGSQKEYDSLHGSDQGEDYDEQRPAQTFSPGVRSQSRTPSLGDSSVIEVEKEKQEKELGALDEPVAKKKAQTPAQKRRREASTSKVEAVQADEKDGGGVGIGPTRKRRARADAGLGPAQTEHETTKRRRTRMKPQPKPQPQQKPQQKKTKSAVGRPPKVRDKKEDKEDKKIWEVEQIVASMIEADTYVHYYMVKWKGWATSHNTWEPKKNLNGCQDLIDQFERKRRQE